MTPMMHLCNRVHSSVTVGRPRPADWYLRPASGLWHTYLSDIVSQSSNRWEIQRRKSTMISISNQMDGWLLLLTVGPLTDRFIWKPVLIWQRHPVWKGVLGSHRHENTYFKGLCLFFIARNMSIHVVNHWTFCSMVNKDFFCHSRKFAQMYLFCSCVGNI